VIAAYDEPPPVWVAADDEFEYARLAPGVCARVWKARGADGWSAGVQSANGTNWRPCAGTFPTIEAAKDAAVDAWQRGRR
jgi:hypothetical protein